MSEPSATVPAKPESTPSARPLWVEFLIFFALGFGVMFLYWLMQAKTKETAQASAPAVIHGQPLINIGAKSPDASDPLKTDASAQKTVLPEAPAKTEAASAKTPAAKSGEGKTGDETYTYTSWDTLGGFFYQPPDPDAEPIPGLPKPKNEIPKSIQAMNGKKVLLQGYMVPLRTKKGEVTEFILCKFVPACCFGDTIKMNEWVHVKMQQDKSCQYVPSQTITVFGTFDVGEVKDQGVVLSIFRMTADQVAGPPEL